MESTFLPEKFHNRKRRYETWTRADVIQKNLCKSVKSVGHKKNPTDFTDLHRFIIVYFIKVGSLLNFRMWFKNGLEAFALYLPLRPVTVGSGRVELTCET